MSLTPKLTAHHFGLLTRDILQSLEVYKKMGFENASKIFEVTSQKVKVCFVEIGDKIFLEMVEFNDDNTALSKIFKSKNPYYHVGYLVEDIDATIAQFETEGFYLVNVFSSEAFKGKKCAFMYTTEMHLIELIEADGV